jgi:hypothetical protein
MAGPDDLINAFDPASVLLFAAEFGWVGRQKEDCE